METLSIGQVARRAGVGVETVRFYEREGLLLRPARNLLSPQPVLLLTGRGGHVASDPSRRAGPGTEGRVSGCPARRSLTWAANGA